MLSKQDKINVFDLIEFILIINSFVSHKTELPEPKALEATLKVYYRTKNILLRICKCSASEKRTLQ